MFLQCFCDTLAYQLETATSEFRFIAQQAQHQDCVGDGRQFSAPAITNGTRRGTCARRADLQCAGRGAANGAATSAECFDLHHGDGDQVAMVPVPAGLGRCLSVADH